MPGGDKAAGAAALCRLHWESSTLLSANLHPLNAVLEENWLHSEYYVGRNVRHVFMTISSRDSAAISGIAQLVVYFHIWKKEKPPSVKMYTSAL